MGEELKKNMNPVRDTTNKYGKKSGGQSVFGGNK